MKTLLKFYKKNWKEISGAIISLAAILVTILQFLVYKENEFRKSLFSEQFEIYKELVERTSILSLYNKDTTDLPHYNKALKEYEQFQKGKLMLVNDNNVKCKVEFFVNKAKNYYGSTMERSSLQYTLDSLCNCCRVSLQETFDVYLPDLVLPYEDPKITELDNTFDKSN